MLHNCTARNRFFLGVFRCSAWHAVSEILRPILCLPQRTLFTPFIQDLSEEFSQTSVLVLCLLVVNGRIAGNIAAQWSGRSPVSLGVPEVYLPKVVGKALPIFGSSAPDDCLLFGKQWFRTSLPMFGTTASDGWLPSYPALLPEGSRQWHGPTRTSASQNRALIPWGLTKSCELTMTLPPRLVPAK